MVQYTAVKQTIVLDSPQLSPRLPSYVSTEKKKKNLCNSVLKLALSCFTLDRFGHKDLVSRKKPKNLRREDN